MKFDHEKIKEKLRNFWKANKNELHYFLKGKEVFHRNISSCNFQLKECETTEEYNFEVDVPLIRMTIDSVEMPYTANFFIKVVPDTSLANDIPGEKIVEIHDNRINLYKFPPFN